MNVVYQAEDGTIFTKKEDCISYERRLRFDKFKIKEIIKSLNAVKEMCSSIKNCSLCPFWNSADCVCCFSPAPQDWDDKFVSNELA